MKFRHAFAAVSTLGLLATSTASAQFLPRVNGLAYGNSISIGHTANPEYDLDIRNNHLRAVYVESAVNSGRSTSIFARNGSIVGTAIFGLGSSAGGRNVGVYGKTNSPIGKGVLGHAEQGSGVHGRTSIGVAVLGESTGNGYAGMFLGGENYFENNVGIGVVNPAMPLHVSGNVRLDNSRIYFGAPNENNGDLIFLGRENLAGDVSTLTLQLGSDQTPTGQTDWFRIRTGNAALIWFSSNGDAFKPNGGAWSVLSDERAKHDIEELDGTLDKLLDLHGKSFYYNDPTAMGAGEGQRVGFIAQEVEDVFPQWVGEMDDGTKTLSITGFEAMAVEALRDLRQEKDAQIAALDKELGTVRSENEELAKRLATLEAMLRELTAAE